MNRKNQISDEKLEKASGGLKKGFTPSGTPLFELDIDDANALNLEPGRMDVYDLAGSILSRNANNLSSEVKSKLDNILNHKVNKKLAGKMMEKILEKNFLS